MAEVREIDTRLAALTRDELLYLAADGLWTPRQIAFARWRAAAAGARIAGRRYLQALDVAGTALAALAAAPAGSRRHVAAQLAYAQARAAEDRLSRADDSARRREQHLWAEYRALVD